MRKLLIGGASLALALVLSFTATPGSALADDNSSLTVLATTDVHAHVYNWDYFADQPYPDDERRKQPLGLEHVSSIVKSVKAERGADSVVVVDNGDLVQGTPLSYLSAVHPDKFTGKPLPTAMNLIGYDALNLGNHEFNYGLSYLASHDTALNAPLLGANVLKPDGTPAYTPTVMLTKTVSGHPVKVGIVGVVTTGVKVWDKAHVSGKLTFADPVTTADKYATELKAAGADVVIVLSHGGADSPEAPYTPTSDPENVSTSIAKLAKNVDAVVIGHTHQDAPKTVVAGASGHDVIISQAYYWGRGVAEITLPLKFDSGSPEIDYANMDAKAIYSRSQPSDPAFANNPVLKQAHEATIAYVNSKVGVSTEELKTETSRYEDTPILDFIAKVQTDTVAAALKGTPNEGIPVISQVSPFSRTSVFPKGDLRIRDIAGLYVFDNTLGAIKMTGAQLKEYLEWSARYFVQTKPGATFDPENGTNAVYDGARPIPDYNFDAVSGVTYAMDVSKPVGQRIVGLSYNCKPVKDDDTFIMAINNYRMSGAGAAAFVKDAPVVWNELLEIRQLLIDHATKVGTIDPKDFFEKNWELNTTGANFADPKCAQAPTPQPTPTPGRPLPKTGAGDESGLVALAALVMVVGVGLAYRRKAR